MKIRAIVSHLKITNPWGQETHRIQIRETLSEKDLPFERSETRGLGISGRISIELPDPTPFSEVNDAIDVLRKKRLALRDKNGKSRHRFEVEHYGGPTEAFEEGPTKTKYERSKYVPG